MKKRKKYLQDDACLCLTLCFLIFVSCYLVYSLIISIYPQFHIMLNLRGMYDSGDYLFRDNHFIFVGGLHQSSTSVTERLLSSQTFSSGLRADLMDVKNRTGCVKPDYYNQYRCLAPENEGIFLTKEFQKYYQSQKRSCSIRAHEDYGHCVDMHHMTELDFNNLGIAKSNTFRSNLFRDWSYFWTNTSKPYLVEKDISNLIKSRFLQSLFGPTRTAFVFLIRHPMADCKEFKCDISLHLTSWLRAYSKVEEDLTYLNNYIVLHQEGYIFNVSSIVSKMQKMFNWPYIRYFDEREPLSIENGLIDLYKHQVMKNKKDAENLYQTPNRRLIFHSNDTIDVEDYTVVIRQSKATIDWINSYNQKIHLPANWKSKDILESMNHHLEKWCYSYETLIPICKDNHDNIIHYTFDDITNSSIGYSFILKSSEGTW